MTVKPLVWKRIEERIIAETILGTYKVFLSNSGMFKGRYILSLDGWVIGDYGDEMAARSAAWDHYEAKVLSAVGG